VPLSPCLSGPRRCQAPRTVAYRPRYRGEALTGHVTAQHRFLLHHLLRHIEFLDDVTTSGPREQ